LPASQSLPVRRPKVLLVEVRPVTRVIAVDHPDEAVNMVVVTVP
jgi:hypothetical protein